MGLLKFVVILPSELRKYNYYTIDAKHIEPKKIRFAIHSFGKSETTLEIMFFK